MNILIVASENGGLDGGKVGGMGDVIRDIPGEIAKHNATVHVITPSHGFLHQLEGARWHHTLTVRFYGCPHETPIYEVPANTACPGVRHWVIDHPGFDSYDSARALHRIYTDDPPDRPFATDATKFALFGMAVAEAIREHLFNTPDCVHLHDWHTAFFLILQRFHPTYRSLQRIRTVFTIHNIALQGIRPFKNSDSSLEAWYPHMDYEWKDLADPRWPDCLNLMAVGIRLADAVHTVSASYAEEILLPSDKPRYYGGEGLENDLRAAKHDNRFFGIINGCDYPPDRMAKPDDPSLWQLFKNKTLSWAGSKPMLPTPLFLAYARLTDLQATNRKPPIMVTSVSRVVDQKLYLMQKSGTTGQSGLEDILKTLGQQGIYFLLGTGDARYEDFLALMSSRYDNFVFLNGYCEACAEALYASGDIFLMPSSFEPCGISQMMAMRAGQPCLAHRIGGLKDTIIDHYNGFTFQGDTVEAQVDQMVNAFEKVLQIMEHEPETWQRIRNNAAAARFSWEATVNRYFEKLYQTGP